MVRAANMKLTVDKETGVIVNISGGGCPDVPYLAREMIGKSLQKAPKPQDIGHTPCAGMPCTWPMRRWCADAGSSWNDSRG
ncbi:MAG: hypothetical protein U5L00_16225 [Desulfovermiculus sp.]|nr:hypothetical protein [Desulfovermiculus sp.]